MKKSKVHIFLLILNLILFLFWVYAFKAWLFFPLDDFINRFYFRQVANDFPNQEKVVLVKIDEKFFNQMGVTTWTFHRWYYAQALGKLNKWGAKNIAFDVYFWKLITPKWDNKLQVYFNKLINYFNNELVKALSWNVVLGVIPYGSGVDLPSEKYLNKKVWLWYVESHTNKNWINDWIILYKKVWNLNIITLWIAAYLNRLYLNWNITKDIRVSLVKWKYLFGLFQVSPDYLIIKTSNPNYDIKLPLTKWLDWIDYLLIRLINPNALTYQFSLADILQNKIEYPESVFDGKTVFIWATDQTLNDLKSSYIGTIPWVFYHISSFLSILNRNLPGFLLYKLPYGTEILILAIIFFISFMFVNFYKDEKISFIAFLVISLVLIASSWWFFVVYWIVISLGTFLVLLLLKLLLDIFHILVINEEKKKKYSELFSKYVWKNVLKKKEEAWEKKLGEKKSIALMFSDIAWFTNISEKLTAQEVIDMLNVYFDKATFKLKSTWIYIDKFIGDAIMWFWEDLNKKNKKIFDDIAEWVLSFQLIHDVIEKAVLNKIWKDIKLKTRIGLHYGDAIVWDLWTSEKLNYTAIGDSVNLASRLEGINKYYWTRVIMSENFYDKILDKDKFAIRLLDKITVKWKSEPVKIYEMMLIPLDKITDWLRNYINDFEIWLQLYFKWEFFEAKKVWENLLSTEYWKNDPTLKIFLERIDYLLKNKPENWDGVWRFNVK